ncbi:MAG: NUDIX domain-containing protein [Candidatus Heimdallarchaeota archaeon]|nr:NUDIX domain-containing protein [Candidatus Heimdallarchaeota archaeon]
MSKALFLVAVTAIIENNTTGKILLIRRSNTSEDSPGYWEDVGGRLKKNEEPEIGLRREIQEETGITDIEIVKPLTVFHVFRKGLETAENELMGISYWCKTNTKEVTISFEHSEYQWVNPEEAVLMVNHPVFKKYLEIQIAEKKLIQKTIII